MEHGGGLLVPDVRVLLNAVCLRRAYYSSRLEYLRLSRFDVCYFHVGHLPSLSVVPVITD